MPIFVVNHKFHFEEEVRNSLGSKELEFNEFSTIAFCSYCKKEIVTAVSYEKIKGESCGDITQWILCWALPACMYKNKRLVHKCSLCGEVLAQVDC